MNDPSAGAWVTGPRGDTMDSYLVIENDVSRQAKYHTDGKVWVFKDQEAERRITGSEAGLSWCTD